jgi:uncharacterized protein
MPRPIRCRKIGRLPDCVYYKPAGVPGRFLEEVTLTFDEFEALRLADFEGLYQEDAAKQMKISRQTFGNILSAAHRKVAECLLKGKALKIEGGRIEMPARQFKCADCGHLWQAPCRADCPETCPACQCAHIQPIPDEQGMTCAQRRRACRKLTQEEII